MKKFSANVAAVLALATGLCLSPARAARTEPTSAVGYAEAFVEAQALAAGEPALSVMRVQGVSMLPYFGRDSVLVVKRIAADELSAGMIVVYRNRFGETIAHRLVAQDADGSWRVRGYNNRRDDSTRVDAGNLLGVVYATFYSSGSGETAVASRDSGRADVALAAPAR